MFVSCLCLYISYNGLHELQSEVQIMDQDVIVDFLFRIHLSGRCEFIISFVACLSNFLCLPCMHTNKWVYVDACARVLAILCLKLYILFVFKYMIFESSHTKARTAFSKWWLYIPATTCFLENEYFVANALLLDDCTQPEEWNVYNLEQEYVCFILEPQI